VLGDPANDREAEKLRRAPLSRPTSEALAQATRKAVETWPSRWAGSVGCAARTAKLMSAPHPREVERLSR